MNANMNAIFIYVYSMATGSLLHHLVIQVVIKCTSTHARQATVAVCRTAVWESMNVSISMSTATQMPSAAAIGKVSKK